jgi:chromosome segregation ATPase
MSDISNRINTLSEKLKRISKRMKDLEETNQKLEKSNRELKAELAEKTEQSQSIQAECERLKLAKTLVSTSSDKPAIKYKVNELVREIDKCIALLNR